MTIVLLITALSMLDSDPEELIDAYAHTVGTVLMVMGGFGVLMNSLALIYFIRYSYSDRQTRVIFPTFS